MSVLATRWLHHFDHFGAAGLHSLLWTFQPRFAHLEKVGQSRVTDKYSACTRLASQSLHKTNGEWHDQATENVYAPDSFASTALFQRAGCWELVRITLLYSVSDVPTTTEFPLALMKKSDTIVASGGRPGEIDRKL